MNNLVGNKLKILRKNKKMSQEEVADFLGISQSAYARMESGESSSWANYILKICEVFAIFPEELLKVEDLKPDADQKEDPSRETGTHLSDKVIEQYEERIKELRKIIKKLKKERKLK
ncbi:helix-turn-helix transcriptional regulator [Flavobacterium sp. T12S277]|uniref:helix-turn-helix transcriptional regulator n=1 Tax=Flavobacterium sp. T12S277 TaxID=3402752 RepID=UPI003ADD22F9